MKLYTRSGDDGTTGLFGGGRVGKDHPRVEAYGTVDEVNAFLGFAAAACDSERPTEARFLEILVEAQSWLFDIGADLATPEGNAHESQVLRIGDTEVAVVEGWIDEVDGRNEPMRSFVMPGGCELAARLHLARTICRRAERLMVALSHTEPVSEGAIRYMNRLSDLLFAMSRLANRDRRVDDIPWIPAKQRSGE